MSNTGDSVYFSRVRKEILPLLPATPGRYLEIGCGTGHNLAMLGGFGHVDGLELDEVAAVTARMLAYVSSFPIEPRTPPPGTPAAPSQEPSFRGREAEPGTHYRYRAKI